MLKRWIKRLPYTEKLLQRKIERPDDWIYTRSTLEWIFEPSLRQQLPIAYKIFSLYCHLFFKIIGATKLRGGRTIFHATANLSKLFGRHDYLRLKASGYKVFLDPLDARFFQVINELINCDSDTHVLFNLLSAGDTFVDVGANHGSFSIVASKVVGPEGLVISIEPQPRLANAVEKSLNSNALCKFQVHQVAVGDSNDQIELFIPNDTSGSAGIYRAYSGIRRYHTVSVRLRCFDELVDWQMFPGKPLIKLDIEGSEYAFLTGARKMITSLKPNLIVEINPKSLRVSQKSVDDFRGLLQDLGYTQYCNLTNINEKLPIEYLDFRTQRNILTVME